MPVMLGAIPAALGFSSLAAAPLAGAATTGITAGLGASIGKIGLSVGLSLGASLLMPKPKPPKPSGGQVETQQSIPPRTFVYGRMSVSGPCVFKKKQVGAISPGLFKVIAVSLGHIDAFETIYGDNRILVTDGSGWVTNGPFHQAGVDKVQVFRYRGTDSQAADAFLMGQFPDMWTADHRLRGTAYAVMAAHGTNSEDFSEAYPQGEPTFKALIRGRHVYDPRDSGQDPDDESTWMWSDNPALCVLDWCATNPNGYGLGLDRFDMPSFEDMADVCDELVPLNWIAASEKRYRVATQVSLAEPRTDVLGRLRLACDAHLVKVGSSGVWGIRGGRWTAPAVTIDASKGHVLQAETRAGVDAFTRYNEADIRYMSPDHGYAEQECDAWQRVDDDEYAAGKILRNQLDLTTVPSFSQARRLAKIYSAYDNPDFIGSLTTNFYGGHCIGEQTITLLWSETTGDDVDGGAFWLDPGMQLLENMTGMTLPIRSCNPAAYDWDEAVEEGTRPKPLPPSDYVIDPGVACNDPTDFAVVGGVRSATCSWTFDDVHTTTGGLPPMYCGRVWRAHDTAGFQDAIEVSGPRYRYKREDAHLETWTDTVKPGTWRYWLTIESANGDMGATPIGPISVTVT